jgi:hypothetical protein
MVLFPLFAPPRVNVFIPFGVAAMGIGLYTWFHPGLRRADPEDVPATPVASTSIGDSRGEVQ